jgi:hypothetical protein
VCKTKKTVIFHMLISHNFIQCLSFTVKALQNGGVSAARIGILFCESEKKFV